MRETQALGVQQHAVHALHAEDAVVAAITVAGVADHLVRQVLEVAADLPEAPGLWLAAQQRVARWKSVIAGFFTGLPGPPSRSWSTCQASSAGQPRHTVR
ncbi:hypothetical protein G6F32_016320 [Rhizopus arrhizus]|nr:hypothetical protein G6F32_016320 [Rhizopus arrhizus]